VIDLGIEVMLEAICHEVMMTAIDRVTELALASAMATA